MSLIICEFQPEMIRLIDLVETNLHYLVRQQMTREQAMDLKQRLALPLGVLSSRFNMQTRCRARPKDSVMSWDITKDSIDFTP